MKKIELNKENMKDIAKGAAIAAVVVGAAAVGMKLGRRQMAKDIMKHMAEEKNKLKGIDDRYKDKYGVSGINELPEEAKKEMDKELERILTMEGYKKHLKSEIIDMI